MRILLAGFLLLIPLHRSLFPQGNSVLDFADHLYNSEQYDRAITEYERYLYTRARTARDSGYGIIQIEKCYYLAGNYQGAISYFEAMRPVISNVDTIYAAMIHYAGLSYLKLGHPGSAILFLRQNTDDPRSQYFLGVSNLYLYNWDEAHAYFKALETCDDTSIAAASKRLAIAAQDGERIKAKSPILAAILSGIIPGSGYLYTGNYQTAFVALVINSLLLGSSYEIARNGLKVTGTTATVLSMGWYLGNIFGSFNAAVKYNDRLKKEHIAKSLPDW
ncbi:MAG: hypothetical protein ACETWG_06560 [Candidatus Neomarinimicrobiota bacterium]